MPSFNIYLAPGHLIRRAQQIVVSLFQAETNNRVTPVQYALMAILADSDGLDQVTLSRRVALDASTSGSTLERLAAKGWVERKTDPADRRRRVLSITAKGRRVFEATMVQVETVQRRILEPLDPNERVVFMRLLAKLVHMNNELSRAPLRMDEAEAPAAPAKKSRKARVGADG